jgi:hypothetical protein
MQVPVSSNQGPDRQYEEGSGIAYQARTGLVLPIESQLQLRALYEYLDGCKATLNQIDADVSLYESHPGAPEFLQRAAGRLKGFCMDAESWGFDALYEIALRLQTLLLRSSSALVWDNHRYLLYKGLAMLSSLLGQCEHDFRRKLAVADMLETLDQAVRN